MGKPPKSELERLRSVRVGNQVLVLFTRQLVTLLEGGVPLVRALETLTLQEDQPDFGRVVDRLCQDISSGHRFSDALGRFSQIFPQVYRVMVQIGEESGALVASLSCLADWLERDGKLGQRIRSALTYPAFVMALACCLTLALFLVVMPPFMAIFEEMRVELPLITRLVMGLTRAVARPLSWLVFALLAAGLWRQLRGAWSDPNGKAFLFGLGLQVPLLGAILWNGSISRFCFACEALLRSGSSLPKTLRMAAAVSGSPFLEQDREPLAETVMQGNPASEHMRAHPELYSGTLTHMTAAGEEVSRLPEMMGRAGHFHELEMETQVETLKAALEPVMLLAVALLVGVILLSVFLPLYGFLNQIE